MDFRKEEFQNTILLWYKGNGRKLPWRETTDPYKILVSEMMLQQTQVERVLLKYQEFFQKFPTLEVLAQASPADVLRIWSGLGYNRRALYLQQCAQIIVKKHKHLFPQTEAELQTLPGIGIYTAAALLSFAYNKSVPVVDVNIERIFKRVFYGKKINYSTLIPENKSRDWHNALMDIGALFCTATSPRCNDCPLKQGCPSANNATRIEATWKKKKVVPFQKSDRIVRGTILKLLTRENSQEIDSLYDQLLKQSIKRGRKKFEGIVKQLEKDGLIEKRDNKITLP